MRVADRKRRIIALSRPALDRDRVSDVGEMKDVFVNEWVMVAINLFWPFDSVLHLYPVYSFKLLSIFISLFVRSQTQLFARFMQHWNSVFQFGSKVFLLSAEPLPCCVLSSPFVLLNWTIDLFGAFDSSTHAGLEMFHSLLFCCC